MNAEKALDLFHQALAIQDLAARQSFLKGACGDDPDLLAHVQKLLAAHAGAEDLFPTDPGDDATILDPAPLGEGPGSQIGKYKLLQQIGEGGMGVVYLAEEQGELRRKVAFKIIKLGMDTRSVVARFEAERQALALMDHRNIAKVFDAGATDTGRPFFVMELVKGIPITEYCDKQKLTVEQRLELFIPVCEAIQHAHHKGIIHRDIKPSNVLVAHFDGKPVPLVIDFGIAKATHQRLTEKTQWTEFGQFIGTPAYVSPEQAEGSQLDIDTRSDLYSLGVLLYELLTGSTPFPDKRLRSAGWKEMQRIILEDEPDRPSTRLSTLNEEERTTLSKAHPEGLGRISLLLRRELDWVVMKCLEKDRSRRYETASQLAQEIANYLKGEAVIAVPPSGWYRFSKLARKHKKTFAMAAAIAVILAGATVISTWQSIRAMRAEKIAVEEGRFSGTLNDFLLEDLLSISDAWADDTRGAPRKVDLTLFEAIVAAEKLVAKRFESHPATESRVRLIIGKALSQFTNSSAAIDNLKRAYELALQVQGEAHTNALESKLEYGRALFLWNRDFFRGTEPAEKAAREAKEQEGFQHVLDTARIGEAHLPLGHPLTIRATIEAAIVLRDADFRYPDKADLQTHAVEAERYTLRAVELAERAVAQGKIYLTPLLLRAKSVLANYRWLHGRRPEDRLLSKQLLRDEDAWHARTNPEGQYSLRYIWLLLGVADYSLRWDRNVAEFERYIEKALRISKEQVGRAHPTGAIYADFIRLPAIDRGDFATAYQASREALRCFEETEQNPEWNKLYAGYVLADAAAWGDWQQTLDELVSMRERGLGRDPSGRGYALNLARELLVRQVMGETNQVPEIRRQFWEAVGDQQLFLEPAYLLSLPCPAEERSNLAILTARGINRESDLDLGLPIAATFLRGVQAYRLDEKFRTAEEHFKTMPHHTLACFYLAMTYSRIGEPSKATEFLERGNVLFEQSLARGNLRRMWWNDETWAEAAMTLLIRAEAETLINGKVTPRRPLMETLAEKRPGWDEVRKLINDGEWEGRHRRYQNAKAIYDQMANHPAYNFRAAQEAHWIGWRPYAIRWALNDPAGQIEVLRQLHATMAPNETDYLGALAEFSRDLPADLKVRLESSPARIRLERKAISPGVALTGDEPMTLGMLRYREGRYAEALEFLAQPIGETSLVNPVVGRVFAAMAHQKLDNHTEARKLLKEADERFNTMVIVPGEGMYPMDFVKAIVMEMFIKEADAMIDPGVTNAPHVAALPPEGW